MRGTLTGQFKFGPSLIRVGKFHNCRLYELINWSDGAMMWIRNFRVFISDHVNAIKY